MKFEQGQEIAALYFSDGSALKHHSPAGDGGVVDSIVVVMENGQMESVPWLLVTYSSGKQQKWNAALVEGVELKSQ